MPGTERVSSKCRTKKVLCRKTAKMKSKVKDSTVGKKSMEKYSQEETKGCCVSCRIPLIIQKFID